MKMFRRRREEPGIGIEEVESEEKTFVRSQLRDAFGYESIYPIFYAMK
jgi:hypothetical protein